MIRLTDHKEIIIDSLTEEKLVGMKDVKIDINILVTKDRLYINSEIKDYFEGKGEYFELGFFYWRFYHSHWEKDLKRIIGEFSSKEDLQRIDQYNNRQAFIRVMSFSPKHLLFNCFRLFSPAVFLQAISYKKKNQNFISCGLIEKKNIKLKNQKTVIQTTLMMRQSLTAEKSFEDCVGKKITYLRIDPKY